MGLLSRLGSLSLLISSGACAPFAVGVDGGAGGTGATTSPTVASSVTASSNAQSSSAITSTTSQSSSSGTTTGGDHVYTRAEDATEWSRAPVEVYWPGVKAPPSTGITAVVDLQKFEDLFVFVRAAGTTTVHRRVGAVWRDPAPLSTYFPLLADTDEVESASHVPYWSASNMSCGAPEFPNDESIRLVTTTGDVWDFDVDPNGFIFERQTVDNPTSWTTGLYGGPALPGWLLEVAPDPDLCGNLGWYINYALMGGKIYFADGRLVENVMPPRFLWEELPLTAAPNPIFRGLSGEPDPTAMVAGFYDLATRTYGFVGP